MELGKYFEKRHRTYPQKAKGRFRTTKNITGFICLMVFFLAPFLRWHRGDLLPDQAIMIDIVHSRAYFFFIEIWPEEVYYLTGILIFSAITLFFITSLFGRIWCGYSCPQTVWTDLFVAVERFFQGDRNQRILLDRKTHSIEKFLRKSATHLVWIIIGLITGFGFVLYFNDSWTLLNQLQHLSLSYNVLGWILGIALATYIMAGFAREQVCNYMCPYARFQSVMFDKNTMIISYDENRGEPRAKHKKGESFDNRGHCIDCKQCVVVCPQNIDIRNGLQMECIACGLCIDACDEVMAKIGLPPGLIKYDTEQQHQNKNNQPNINIWHNIMRPRTFYYVTILTIVGGLIMFNLTFKSHLRLNIIADRNPLFVTLSDGSIRNGYTLKIQNKDYRNKNYHLEISGIQGITARAMNSEWLDLNQLPVSADNMENFKIYVTIPSQNITDVNGRTYLNFTLIDNQTGEKTSRTAVFVSR